MSPIGVISYGWFPMVSLSKSDRLGGFGVPPRSVAQNSFTVTQLQCGWQFGQRESSRTAKEKVEWFSQTSPVWYCL